MLSLDIVEEISGLDVAVDDAFVVDGFEGGEEGVQVDAHVVGGHAAEVFAEVLVLVVGKDGEDLVLVPESGDQGAY